MASAFESKLLGSATVFVVSNLEKSVEFYQEKLGFELSYSYGEPAIFSIIDRDDCCIHLVSVTAREKGLGKGSVYIFASEVDLLFAEYKTKEIETVTSPVTYDHGMREITIEDLDGNQLTIGASVEEQN